MYNIAYNRIEDINPEEVNYLRKILPAIKIGKEKIFRNGEYKIGYDLENKEAMLFKLGKPITEPNQLELVIYEIFNSSLTQIREGSGDANHYSRFRLD